jgi:hypothetical protein
MFQSTVLTQKGFICEVTTIVADISSVVNYLVNHEEVLQRLSTFTGDITNLSYSSG